MATTDTSRFSWPGIDPAEWMRTWQAVWRGGPDNLVQPILPGWTFNINSSNSTAPQTEVDVVAKHSYGRQIGRMSDALELLIEERHGKTPKDKRFSDFLTMKHEIDNVNGGRSGCVWLHTDKAAIASGCSSRMRPVAVSRSRYLYSGAIKTVSFSAISDDPTFSPCFAITSSMVE